MFKGKFWQKLTGAVRVDDEYDTYDEFEDVYDEYDNESTDIDDSYEDGTQRNESDFERSATIESNPVMELPFDMYSDNEKIYIEAFIPGVSIDKLNIELSREFISISGERLPYADDDNFEYISRELEWGEFTRSITLPEEVDIDSSSATESNGVLKIVLPKFNKLRKAKLTVKSLKK